ncbi:MAG: oligosaccharide flippase family protein [Lachnoclostridium sp.]|nr:oligosaccharide flippase family protein [Lachnoclostridium sp.]
MKKKNGSDITHLVLKAMGVFGGVQSLSILCSVIRMKLVALWIGVPGVGLFAIFNQAFELISSTTQLSIRSSSVRDIAAHKSSAEAIRNATALIVRKWGWMLGLFGAVVMLATAPLFSRFTFGNYDHTWQFALLSVCVFLSAITSSEGAIMQGLERYKRLALSTLYGTFGGLIISIPMFYFLKINSIIPSIIAYVVSLATATVFYRIKGLKTDHLVTRKETLEKGRTFIVLGAYMTASGFVAMLLNYVLTAYLNYRGGETLVGFYQAGYTLVNKYVGLIFVAIGMEFYPRLASVSDSIKRSSVYISHEISLIMMLLISLVTIFICVAQLTVKIIYSEAFIPILPFVVLSMAGMVFRGFSWCMSYGILARGEGSVYIWTESVSSVLGLIFNIIAYEYYGITGFGISFTLWYMAYAAIIYGVTLRRGIRISHKSLMLTLLTLIVVSLQIFFYFTCDMWVLFGFALACIFFTLISLLKF